jgi:hypothetical protein
MVDPVTGETKDDMRRVHRHIEAVLHELNHVGIVIRDMKVRTYESGMALKVISFEPTPGLCKEIILETIKPSIVWQSQLIQTGEVIIGTPQMK